MSDHLSIRTDIPFDVFYAQCVPTKSATIVEVFHLAREMEALKRFQEGTLPATSQYYKEFNELNADEIPQMIADLTEKVNRFRRLLTRDDTAFIFRKARRFRVMGIDL